MTVTEAPNLDSVRDFKPRSSRARDLGYIAVGFSAIPGGLFFAKVSALTVGPKGLGTIAALQAISTVVTLFADANVGQGMIRKAREEPERAELFVSAARLITMIGSTISVILCALIAPLVGRAIVGGERPALSFAVAGAAGGLVMISAQEVNILSARKNDRGALLGLFVQGFVGPIVAGLFLVIFEESYAAFALLLAAVTALVCRRLVVGGQPSISRTERRSPGTRKAIRELLVFGGPLTAAAVFGAGSSALVPILLRTLLGSEATGYFRAAALVSGGYTAGLLGLLARRYFPRLAAENDPLLLRRAIEQQIRLSARFVCLCAIVVVFAAPTIVRLLFSSQFGTSSFVLKVLVIADVLKFVAWSVTFVVLARLSPRTYVRLEGCGAGVLIACVCVGTWLGGLSGAVSGMMVAYACYLSCALRVVFRGLALSFRVVATREAIIGCSLVGATVAISEVSGLMATQRFTGGTFVFVCALYRAWRVMPLSGNMFQNRLNRST